MSQSNQPLISPKTRTRVKNKTNKVMPITAEPTDSPRNNEFVLSPECS